MKLIKIANKESIHSIIQRFLSALWRSRNRPEWANHFCHGKSGSGEWSHRSLKDTTICGYCKK